VRRRVLLFAASLVTFAVVASAARTDRLPLTHDVRPGSGVTVKRLSDYLPSLSKTAGDTAVYVIEGAKAGGTAFVAGATHGNEFAGIMTAIVLTEHVTVQKGRLIVVPHANNAAMREAPAGRRAWVTVTGAGGARRFRFGSRLTPVPDQGASDARRYTPPGAAASLAGREGRNLDRVYPGRDDGTLTERVAAAIVSLLRGEHVDLAFDLHESGPNSRVAWAVMASANAASVVQAAQPALDAEKLRVIVMPAKGEFSGVSQIAWPQATGTRAFLFETPSPAPTGQRLPDEVNDSRLPLARRVGAHLAGIVAIVDGFNREARPDRQIRLRDVPTGAELARSGVGAFLR
jgi:predicted deacylase